ncbi:MAG: glycosyltransferase family 1 protein, partial [Litorilinea sp.]
TTTVATTVATTGATATYALDARTAHNHFPGIGRYVSNLARAMPPHLGDQEHLLLLFDPGRASRWELPTASAQITLRPTPVSPFSLQQQWQIPRALNHSSAQLYHSAYFLIPYAVRQPCIVTIYDLIPELFPQYFGLHTRLRYRLALWLALRNSQHILTCSQATRRDLMTNHGVAADQITVTPFGADATFRPQSAETIARTRARYALPERYVLYLGINKPHKNLVSLLQGWRQLDPTVRQSTKLVIGGAWDPRYPEAKEAASQLELGESVQFIGPVDEEELPALYTGATAFVFPSLYEGFGLPLLEAMACGVAVACANTSSLVEVAGEAALYFDPYQPAQIARQIHRLVEDAATRQDFAQRALQQAATFSWQNAAQTTLDVYRAMLQKHA